MVYNFMHGTMRGGAEQSLTDAVDAVNVRIKQVMRCEAINALASKPLGTDPATGETQTPTERLESPTADAE